MTSGCPPAPLPRPSRHPVKIREGRSAAFPVVVLCLLLTAWLTSILATGLAVPAGQVLFTVALFVLPLLYAVPGTRPLVWRHRWLALVVQGVLTWVPFALFGGAWETGIGGLLAGLVLLVLPGRASWLLAGMLLAAEVVVRAALAGLPAEPAWFGLMYTVVYYVDDALAFFAMVRLAQIIDEVEQARAAVAQAREVAARHRSVPGQEPAAAPPARAVIGARMAWAVLVTLLLGFTVEGIGDAFDERYGVRLATLLAGIAALAAAVQLYHSRAARRGDRPRAWPVTLAAQAVLVYAVLFPFIRAQVPDLAPFLAGSILLLVRGWWRWAGYAAVTVTWTVLMVVTPLRGSPYSSPSPMRS